LKLSYSEKDPLASYVAVVKPKDLMIKGAVNEAIEEWVRKKE
jgi:hypothetical protein